MGKNISIKGDQNCPHGALVAQMDLMIRARYPLLYIVAVEEEPVEEVFSLLAAQSKPQRKVLLWDVLCVVGMTMAPIKAQ